MSILHSKTFSLVRETFIILAVPKGKEKRNSKQKNTAKGEEESFFSRLAYRNNFFEQALSLNVGMRLVPERKTTYDKLREYYEGFLGLKVMKGRYLKRLNVFFLHFSPTFLSN